MAIDQASADHEREQERRVALQDNQDDWTERAIAPFPEQPIQKLCAQCTRWQPKRLLRLADGTTQPTPGFCTSRAAADLMQMPQAYAEHCRLYEEDIPF